MAERPLSNRASIAGAVFAFFSLVLLLIGWQSDRTKYMAQIRELVARLSAREDPIPDPVGVSPADTGGTTLGGNPGNGGIANSPTYNGRISNGRRKWAVQTSEGLFSCWRVKTGMACAGPANSPGTTGDTSGDVGTTAGPPSTGGTTAGPPGTAGTTGSSSIRVVGTHSRSPSTETPTQSPPSGHVIATPRN
jgi:hypothetical protein